MKCIQCGEEKEKDSFASDKHCKSGRKGQCKDCVRENRRRRLENKYNEIEYEGDELIPIFNEKFRFNDHFQNEENHSIVFIGPKRSGKSTLLKSFWKDFKSKFDIIFVFCNNIQSGIYQFMDEEDRMFTYDKYQPDIIKNMDYFQKQTDNYFQILFVFDDCSSRKGVKYADDIIQLFIRGRNINATILFSTQFLTMLPKESRANIDKCFVFDLRTPEVYEDFTEKMLRALLPNPPELKGRSKQMEWYIKVIKANTEDHRCMVLDYENNKILSHKAKLKKRKREE